MRRAVAAALVLSFGSAAGSAVAADASAATPSPFRYDDDPTVYADAPVDDLYAKLKYGLPPRGDPDGMLVQGWCGRHV